MDKQLVGEFIDAVASEPERASRMLSAHPELKSARWMHDESVLHFLAIEGSAPMVAFLADAGFELDAINEFGDTALNDAVSLGREDVVKVLLDKGANPNCISRTTSFPLYDAIFRGRIGIAQMLVQAGADPRLKGPDGETLGDIVSMFVESGAREQIVETFKKCGLSLSDFE